jgi:hypothetical protein
MVFQPNRPKTGGRQKGVPNKATAAKVQEIAASGETPLDYMLRIMRDDSRPVDMRIDCAKAAAPYVHPKLSAVEHTGKDGEPLIPEAELSPTELARAVAFMLAKGVQDKPTAH